MLLATSHAPAAMAHEMKNAVHGNRAEGAARIAGPHTRSVKNSTSPLQQQRLRAGKLRTARRYRRPSVRGLSDRPSQFGKEATLVPGQLSASHTRGVKAQSVSEKPQKES